MLFNNYVCLDWAPRVQLKSAFLAPANEQKASNPRWSPNTVDITNTNGATKRVGKRAVSDPTAEWFSNALALYDARGLHGSYFEGMFGEVHARQRRAEDAGFRGCKKP